MKLKDFAQICYGKNQRKVEVEHSEIPILGTGGIIGYASKPLYINESVLIGRKGTLGKPFYIDRPFWTIDTLFYTKINKSLIIPRYFYYAMCSLGLERFAEGAAVPSLTTKTLNEIEIPVPTMSKQQHIVDTIGTIDNLIEKNEEIITNARSLINAFYDTIIVETGNSILKDFFVITIGRTPPTKESKWFNSSSRGSVKWLSIKDMAQNSTYIFETSQFLTNDALKKFNIPIVKEGDVLLSFKLTVGRTAIAGANMVTNEAIACFKANSEHRNYLFCYLQRCNFLSDGDNTSSIGKAVNSTIIKNFPFVIPSKESLDTFNKKTHSLFELIKLKQKENITLKTQKATLLCKYFPSN